MSYKPIDEVKVRVEEILVNAESCYEEEAPSISVLAQEIRDAISTAIAECGADEVAGNNNPTMHHTESESKANEISDRLDEALKNVEHITFSFIPHSKGWLSLNLMHLPHDPMRMVSFMPAMKKGIDHGLKALTKGNSRAGLAMMLGSLDSNEDDIVIE